MCVVSIVAEDWTQRHPLYVPLPITVPNNIPFTDYVTRAEYEALRRELESLKVLLTAAKRYDEETGQRDCEDPEKVALVKRLAELVGVDLSDVFPDATVERPKATRSTRATPPGRKAKALST